MTGRRWGFTLVEVVVGLAVGGIVVLAGFAALAAVQDRSAHAAQATTRILEAATVRTTVVHWLSAARLQSGELGVEFEGLDAREHGLEWDELTFVTQADTPVDMPVVAVRLFIDTDPTTPEQGLAAELVGRLIDEPLVMELAPDAIGLRIRYLPALDGTVEWAESWAGMGQLPPGLEITLVEDPATPLPPLLRYPILVAMPTIR